MWQLKPDSDCMVKLVSRCIVEHMINERDFRCLGVAEEVERE